MSEYTPFDDDPEPGPPDTSVSRRDLLKQGAAFVAFAQAPAIATQRPGTTTGRGFRALVRHGPALPPRPGAEGGAHVTVDPNAEADSNALVARLRALTREPTDRPFAGGRGANAEGPDYVIEPVGGERAVPKVERGPDPTGVQVLQQVYSCALRADGCARAASVVRWDRP